MGTAAHQPLIVLLPRMVKAADVEGRRRVYFETSREGVEDRQGEDIAQEALWRCRERFIRDGNLDINHFSWLGNPYGSGQRPEYVIGHPIDVERKGKSIYVRGEVFSNLSPPPAGSNGAWADWFWHSLTQMSPPMRWYASVFGTILESEYHMKNGRQLRYITAVDWFSVGFAQRPQHPELTPVEADSQVLAKGGALRPTPARREYVEVMTLETLAKAMTVGTPVTAAPEKRGVQALTPESLAGSYDTLMPRLLRRIFKRQLAPRRAAIAKAFREYGLDPDTAHAYTERFLLDAVRRLS